MKNKYNANNQEEYTNAYIAETKKQIYTLLAWIKKHPRAKLDTCKKHFQGITNIEEYESGYAFDMNYGNFAVTLSTLSINADNPLEIVDIELWDDDYVAGSGEFAFDTEQVISELKQEFGIEMYAV